MRFETVKDIKTCEQLWNSFSPDKKLFDLWEYRFCFFNKNYMPYFIVGYENKEMIGILPLWHEKKDETYSFFGGEFPEENSFFVKDKSKIKDFLEFTPEDSFIFYILESEKQYFDFEECSKTYFLDMRKYNNELGAYISSFDKKHRKNLKYDLKQLEKLNYEINFNKLEDFNRMVELNIKKFGEESNYNDKNFVDSIKKMIEIAYSQKKLNMISIKINEKTEAVEFAIIHDNIYNVLGGGRNIEIDNIGKLMVVEHIKSALKNNTPILNFCTSSERWKKNWHFDYEMLYKFEK